MTGFKWWMRIVGGFYLVLALLSVPPIRANVLIGAFPDLVGEQTTLAFTLLIDTWFMFGLELGVIGTLLIVFARSPWAARSLVYTVLGLEVVRGIADDLYMIARGHPAAIYMVFIIIHVVIIGTGLRCLQQPAPQPMRAESA